MDSITIKTVLGSILWGIFSAVLIVQVAIFVISLGFGAVGYLKERTFNKNFFILFLKSLLGVVIGGLVAWLGTYVLKRFNIPLDSVDPVLFWGCAAMTVLGFLLNVVRRIKRMVDLVATPEFDEFHSSENKVVDDYVRKNLELLKQLRDGSRE